MMRQIPHRIKTPIWKLPSLLSSTTFATSMGGVSIARSFRNHNRPGPAVKCWRYYTSAVCEGKKSVTEWRWMTVRRESPGMSDSWSSPGEIGSLQIIEFLAVCQHNFHQQQHFRSAFSGMAENGDVVSGFKSVARPALAFH